MKSFVLASVDLTAKHQLYMCVYFCKGRITGIKMMVHSETIWICGFNEFQQNFFQSVNLIDMK